MQVGLADTSYMKRTGLTSDAARTKPLSLVLMDTIYAVSLLCFKQSGGEHTIPIHQISWNSTTEASTSLESCLLALRSSPPDLRPL